MPEAQETYTGYERPARFSSADDEKKHPWLSMLLDAYHIADNGVAEAIEIKRKSGKKAACAKGCSNCCKTHKTIPVYPLELVGISWYVTEKVSGAARRALKNQLRNHSESGPCPFLAESACSIHGMRPISCRQFIVLGKPCSEGEDPYYTRREDVLMPIKKFIDKAFFTMLPFYGVKGEMERLKVIESGAFNKMVKVMQTCNWKSLADKMDAFDKRDVYRLGG